MFGIFWKFKLAKFFFLEAMFFKSKDIFMKAFKRMINDKNKINNEYYVGNSINQLIKENYNVIPFEVEQYICLGTLQDLKVYNFWSGYFND